jgi:hypothetical protein
MKALRLGLLLLASAWLLPASAGEQKGEPDPPGKDDGGRVMKQGLVAHYFKDPDEWGGNWKPLQKPTVDPKQWTFREYAYSRIEPLINHLFVKRGWFSIRWVGYLKVPPALSPKDPGEVDAELELWADDGVRLFLDGQKLLDDWTACPEKEPRSHRRARVKLAAGYHRLVVEYFQGESLPKDDPDPAKLYWTIPALKAKRAIIPASHFFHADEDEKDYVPSQGLSPGDQERLKNGTEDPKKFQGPPVGDKP